ncbi:PKD domain-containing protein, partial [Chitinophaga skermanii]
WSGAFVAGGYFQAGAAPVGNYTVTYTYVDPVSGCTGTDAKIIKVVNSAILDVGADVMTCSGAKEFTPPLPTIGGGEWRSLAGDFYQSGVLLPSKMQLGDNHLIYTVKTNEGCFLSDTLVIKKNPAPVVTIMRDFSICLNSNAVQLQATPAPGVWEGKGIDVNIGSTFFPATAGAGNHTLNYTYSDPITGCSTKASVIATVNSLPIIQLPADTALCISSGVLTLPSGGIWSGSAAITGQVFSPAVAGIGNHGLIFTVVDPSTLCQNANTYFIQVKGIPGPIKIMGDTTACEGQFIQLIASADNVTNFNWFVEGSPSPFSTGSKINYQVTKDEEIYLIPKPTLVGECPGEGRYLHILNNTPTGTAKRLTLKDSIENGALFQAVSNISKATSYLWDFGDGGTSTQIAGNHYYYKPGEYNVSLIVASAFGCERKFVLPKIIVLDEVGKAPDPVFDRGNGIDPDANALLVYPTVFSNKLTCEFVAKNEQEVIITLINITTGLPVLSKKVNAIKGFNRFRIDTELIKDTGQWYIIKITGIDFNNTLKIRKL